MKYFFSYNILILLLIIFPSRSIAQDIGDSIPIKSGVEIQKPIYTDKYKEHNSLYDKLWGKHYRNLYYTPVTAKTVSLNSLFGGMSVKYQLPKLHALIMEDKQSHIYLLKPLGGSSSFLESKFFRNIYEKEDFKDTYLNSFIKEAYTIIHPYMFSVSEQLAYHANLGFTDPAITYITGGNLSDTIADGSTLENNLISISRLTDIKREGVLNSIDSLLDKLHSDKLATVDLKLYIKARIFDMLIGDWNKIPENWYWIPVSRGDSTIYIPQSLDRSHAFSKVDGIFFKELLNMLGIGFITNYEAHLYNVKKFNKLSYPLDIALTQNCTIEDWKEQARILKHQLTEEIIDKTFSNLPPEVQDDEAGRIKHNLISRMHDLEKIASKYYLYTQKVPVITGSQQNERFVIEQPSVGALTIRIYSKDSGKLIFDKQYTRKHTKEIWLYGLGGDDDFEIDKKSCNIALLIIGGEGANNYEVNHGNNVFVYEAKSEKERLKSLKHVRLIIPNDETALDYDYQKLRHTTFSVTPIGLYDSDLGLNIGTSVAYTVYGFRRAPYTRRHQFSYDYVNGFTYQGIFPSYDHKKSLHVVAYIGSPAYFSNFFGFGNNTSGYKGENNNYNRVNISKYMLTPALYYNIKKDQTVNLFSSFEVYEVKNPKNRDRFINTIYEDGHSVYSPKYFLNLGATYEINKKMPHVISSFNLSATAGWYFNFGNSKRNYAYTKGKLGVNLKITDRMTFATQLRGTILFSDKYEFYQAATTELRGFRDNRFIGNQSLYQYSDIRLDMGKLNNPLAPLKYGVFAGVDHGRVWSQGDNSQMWHSSYGGGFWLTILRKFTGKFSYFGSTDGSRFTFQLGMGF